MDVDGDQFRVTAAFLYRVNGNLSSLAESLDRQESAARRLIRAASLDVGLADHHWRGPRSRKVIGSAEDYLATVREYPNAVSAGATTIRRWARAALDSADALASDDWCGTEDVGNPDRRPSGARPSGAREEIVAAWRRTCVAFGGELDAATAGVKAAKQVTSDAGRRGRRGTASCGTRTREPPRAGGGASLVERLERAQHLTLVSAYPGLLAGVEGLPARVRRMARRSIMLEELTRLEQVEENGTLSVAQDRRLRRIRQVLDRPDVMFAPFNHVVSEPVQASR